MPVQKLSKQDSAGKQTLKGAQSCRGLQGDPLLALGQNYHAHQVFKCMLALEEDLAEEWVCFYHSYNHPALVYEVQAAIAKVFFGFHAEYGALPRLLQHPFKTLNDAQAVLKAFPMWPDRDHNPAFKSVGICCSTSLFSRDPEATPTDVFLNGYCVSRVDTTKVVEMLLLAFGVPQYALQMLTQHIMDLAMKYGLPQVCGTHVLQGHLLQIFIHRSCVDRWAYASFPFGVLDSTRHPLSKSLASPRPVVGQARLVVNPSAFVQDSTVRMYTHSADPFFNSHRHAFQDALCQVLVGYIKGAKLPAQVDVEPLDAERWEALFIAYSEAELLDDVRTALKEDGCTDDELPTALKEAGYSASELREAGYPASSLNKAGYTLTAVIDAGYQDTEVCKAGFADADVLSRGYSPTVLKMAGYSASMLKEAGYSVFALNKANYALATLLEAGYAEDGVLKAGFPASDLKKAGYSASALRGAGYTDVSLITAGYTVDALHTAGCAVTALQKAGYTAQTLREFGYPVAALRNASYSEAELLRAGYPAEALRAASCSITDMRKAGYTTDAMQSAGYSAKALKMAGYVESEISKAEYTVAALIEAGYSLGAHRDTSERIVAMWRRSLAQAGQDTDDTVIEFLTTAAMDAVDEEDLAQLLEDYLGECCGEALQELLALGLGTA